MIHRLLSKITDCSLFYLICSFCFSLSPYFFSFSVSLILLFIITFLGVFIEAAFLACYGTTPGRWLLGYRVQLADGKRPSYGQALRKAFGFQDQQILLKQKSLNPGRKVIGYGLSLGCLVLTIFGRFFMDSSLCLDHRSKEGWVQYYSLTRGFTVNFPNPPKEQAKHVEFPDSGKTFDYQEVFSQQKKDVLYSVSYIELPSKWRLAGSTILLKRALDLFVKHAPIKTEIMHREVLLYQNHRALEFQLKEGENQVRGRFILVDNTLYKLTVVYPSFLDQEIDGLAFLDSFDLHPKGFPQGEGEKELST